MRKMIELETRNRYFDTLFANRELRWMGQNTNHIPLPTDVREAIHESVAADEFRAYAPPLGFEELRAAIVEDVGLPGMSAIVTDGGIEALYHVCHTTAENGGTFVTTDPGWKWPALFSRAAGAEIVEIPIYDPECGYHLVADRLAEAVDERTRVIYLVDPNNPLGTCIPREEMRKIATIAAEHDALLIHDCTYRHFADGHTLAAEFYPEKTLTIYSFSKWLGLAGLRVAALIGSPKLLSCFAKLAPNNLGSNVLSQRAAIAGLQRKAEWFPHANAIQRDNQALIRKTVDSLPGFHLPVYPSNGNFLVVECIEADVQPEAIVTEMQKHNIMIRQGSYHTARFGHRFIKVSTTVPKEWAKEFCDLLPEVADAMRGRKLNAALF
jgi:aspartate/methionine/tyrosine aminotransferase